ncbi:MAG: alpha,alpha-trehalase TreF [Methanococcaceae archaeon]
MKRYLLLYLLILLTLTTFPQTYQSNKNLKNNYIQLSGRLFQDVQLSGIFSDSKTFVDAVPLKPAIYITRLYDSVKALPDFELRQFIFANFMVPEGHSDTTSPSLSATMESHIKTLWQSLERHADEKNPQSTLLPLKYPYIVPGGRFREIYYWDSFFTILGLLADGHQEVAENMVRNFAYLLDQYGMIPNGNRVYYLTRSQPPFFALMVDIICRHKNDYSWGLQFLPQLQAEYSFWMNGLNGLKSSGSAASEHVVQIGESSVLNRYFDFDNVPREESFKVDDSLSKKLDVAVRPGFFTNLRAAAESGWDFSSRWLKDGKSLLTIQTTDLIPVDLNCLLYFLEDRLSFFYKLKGDNTQAMEYGKKSLLRSQLINKYFWNEKEGYYFDYNWKEGKQSTIYSLAACFPLYFGIAEPVQAKKTAKTLERKFLNPGGLITTPNETHLQWDAPNGWPPLQWIAIKALREYGINPLAETIKKRWLKLNNDVYKRTGRMVEKYNVIDLRLFAGGGEYKLQDGFGWTNGVAEALLNNFDKLYIFKQNRH